MSDEEGSFRGINDGYINTDDFLQSLTDVLNTAGYILVQKTSAKLFRRLRLRRPAKLFNDNQSFWDAVIKTAIHERDHVNLEGFHMTPWIPLSPGTFFLPESELKRERAERYWNREQVVLHRIID